MSAAVRGWVTGVLRSVSGAPSMYRTVPGRSYEHTRPDAARVSCTGAGTALPTGLSTSDWFQTSDESWYPDTRITVGLPGTAAPRQSR